LVGVQPVLTQVPPDELAFDHGDGHAGGGEPPRQRRAGLPCPDHDGVEAVHNLTKVLLLSTPWMDRLSGALRERRDEQ
jgi:hypothetical protein